MKRRLFLKAVGASALAAQAARAAEGAEATGAGAAGMPLRTLGRTGEKVSIIGFPGLGLTRDDQDTCTAAIHRAFKRGVNYFDVAPAYGPNRICETRMGIGLQGLDRTKYFLACKTKQRDKQGARKELEESLKLLKTDHFDLYQLHALITPDDAEKALAPGGAIETLTEARKEGKVRFLGFSAHTTRAAITAMKAFKFDTVMFPINFVEFFNLGLGKAVMELAKQQGAAVLAIKAMARGQWPRGVRPTRRWWYRSVEEAREVDIALRFTLSQDPVTVAIPPAWLDLLDKAVAAAPNYRPITQAEVGELWKIASTCDSVFRRDELRTAFDMPCDDSSYPDSPHESSDSALA